MIALALLLFQDDYDAKARQIYDKIVAERVKIASGLQSKGLHAWARLEYAKILAHSPDHAKAKAALVDKPIPFVNKIDKEDPRRLAEAYRKDLDALGKNAAKWNADLADDCEKKGRKELARAHRLEALAFDPACRAADALGFKTSKILPVASDPDTVEIFRAFREDAAKTAAAKPATEGWGPDAVVKGAKIIHGARVRIESPWMSEAWMADVARAGDHAFACAQKLLGVDVKPSGPYWFAYLEPAGHESLTAWLYDGKPREAYAFLLKNEWWRNDAEGFRTTASKAKGAPVEDLAHLVPQFVMTDAFWPDDEAPDRAALLEGFAVMCEFVAYGSSELWCIGRPTTGSGVQRAVYREFAAAVAWDVCDTPVDALFKKTFESIQAGGSASKAASVLEFLFSRGRAAAADLLRDLSTSKDPAAALRKHTGWCVEEFDEHWRRWAIAAWQPEPKAKPPPPMPDDERLGPVPDK